MKLNQYIRNIVYSIVLLGVTAAHAGSFEDYFIAIKNDRDDTVRELLDRGFDPNARDSTGQPGLTIAVREGSPKVARLLLARPGIEVDALNQAGESALMIAALKGNPAAVKLMLDRGARVNKTGWSPLHYAATGPDPKLVELMIERGAEIDARSPNGTTALMMAAQYGSEDSVYLLLQRGADPTLRNERNLGVVDFARLSGREPLIKRLETMRR